MTNTYISIEDAFGQTQSDIQKSLDSSLNTPWEDCADSAFTTSSRQSIVAGTEYRFENDALTYKKTNFPAHITMSWDAINNKVTFLEVLDHPVYVSRVQFNFQPSVSANGLATIRAYIDDVTTPKLLQTITLDYKAIDERNEALFAYYVGSEAGYNIKADGVYFTYEFATNGEVYDRGILNYRT